MKRLLLTIPLLLLLVPQLGAEAPTKSNYGGVGLHVVPTAEGQLVVLQVITGAPADRGGIKPGDLIVQVDDFPLQGSDFARVVSDYLWGPRGTSLLLTFLRPGVVGRQQVVLTRTTLDPQLTVTPSVQGAMPEKESTEQ